MNRNLYKKKSKDLIKFLGIANMTEQDYIIVLARGPSAVLIKTLPYKHRFWINKSLFKKGFRAVKQIKL